MLGVVRPPCDHRPHCPSRTVRSTSGVEYARLASQHELAAPPPIGATPVQDTVISVISTNDPCSAAAIPCVDATDGNRRWTPLLSLSSALSPCCDHRSSCAAGKSPGRPAPTRKLPNANSSMPSANASAPNGERRSSTTSAPTATFARWQCQRWEPPRRNGYRAPPPRASSGERATTGVRVNIRSVGR